MAADVIIDPVNGQIYWNDNAEVGTESISIKGDAANSISFFGYGSAYSPGSTPSGTARVTVNDDIYGTLVPGSNGFELGSSSKRWNTYASFLSLYDFSLSGSGGSFDLCNYTSSTGLTQTLNFANTVNQVQFNFGVGASLASTATFFGSVNSNRMVLNVSSSGNVYLQTNQTNARVRLFQNNLTGNVSIFGRDGGTLYLGEDTATNNADIAIKGTVLSGSSGNIRAALFTIATATSNGTGVGGTIQFQTSTSGPAGSVSNVLRTRLRVEGAATGTSNLESVIILGDATSGTAWSSYLRGVDAAGSNVEAGEIQIQAGRSTGSGLAQGVSFYVSSSGAGAAVLNTPLQIGRFTGTGLTIYPVTASSTTTSGALIVAGGAAVGQTLSVGGHLNIFNGANFTGFRFAGSANTVYTLPPRTPTGTGTSFLSSGIDGTMAWVAAPTGGSATPGGADTAIQFNDGGSSFGGTSGGFAFTKATHTVTIGSLTDHKALTSIGLQLYNNNAVSISPSVTQRWSPALEFMGRSLKTSPPTDYRVRFLEEVQTFTDTYGHKLIWKFSYDTGTASYTNPIMALHSQFGVGIGASNSTTINYLRTSSNQSVDQTYTLPTAYPSGTGTSFLSASTTGVMAWVAAPTGGGSGVVNSGTAFSTAYYDADGSTVSGTGLLQIIPSGTAISSFADIDMKSGKDIRFWEATNNLYTSISAGNVSANYDLFLPTAKVGAGSSVIITNSYGQMFFAAPGSGIAFSSATANTPIIRTKRPLVLQFSAGYTPLAAGTDNLVIRVPDSPTDGTTFLTYIPREFYIRVETPSAGSSRIQLERSTGEGAFTLAATGSSYLGGLGLTISGAGIYVTSTRTFAGAFITSGDNLRLNWTLLNATHANFSVQLLLEEV